MDISALVSSISAIGELGKLLINERDRQKAATIQIDLSNKIIESQTQLLQLLGTVVEQQRLIPVLEQRVRELEADHTEKARYQLTKLGSCREFFVYSLRPQAEPLEGIREVEHFLCQPCFDAGNKVLLTGNGEGYWFCPVCKHGAQVEPDNAPTYRSIGRRTIMGRDGGL